MLTQIRKNRSLVESKYDLRLFFFAVWIECSMTNVSELDQTRAHVLVTRELLLHGSDRGVQRPASNIF